MTGVEHSDWLLGHGHYHHAFAADTSNAAPSVPADQPANSNHIDSVASVLKTLWLTEPPALSVGSSALTVDEGGSIALPISVAPSSTHGATTVAIGGLASYETITDQLDHHVFTASASSGSVTLTAAEVNSGLTLSSDYSGPDKPVNTLTVSASETLGHQTLTAAPQTIQVTDPPASTGTSGGSNALTLQVSGDNYNGDPQIEVFVDGTQVGSSSYTITADHSSGQWQTVTIAGNFDPTVAHQVQVELTNDSWDGTSWWASGGSSDGHDINVYVESISLNGATLEGSQAATNTATNGIVAVSDPNTAVLDTDGTLAFNVAAASAPVTSGSGSSTGTVPAGNPLTLQVSGDNYNGDPQIEVFVDGTQVGSSSYLVTADHSSGQWQTITIAGNFSSATAHQVQVEFTNDSWDGTSWWASGGSSDGHDVNVYVESISLNGVTLEGSQAATNTATNGVVAVADANTAVMDTDGTLAFTVADPPATTSGSTSSSGGADPGVGYGSVPSGTGYYVSPSGSDSNPGTLAAPFATLAHAQQAMEGSSIKTTYVEAGTYNLGSTLTLTAADNGESWDYYPANGVDTAVLNGGGSLQTVIELDASNVTINGLTIENYANFGIHYDGGSTISNITIANCNIGDSTATGTWQSGAVFIDNVNGITISHNYIHDVQSEGIALFAFNPGDVLDNVSIDGNVVLNAVQGMTDGGAIYVSDHDGYHGTNTSITNNYVAGYGSAASSRAAGIYLDDSASYWQVTGNVVGPPNPASPNSSQSDYAFEVNNGIHNNISNNVVDLGSTGNVYAVLWYYGDNQTVSLTGPSQSGETFTHNLVLMNFAGSYDPTEHGAYAFFQNSGNASDFTIADNMYYNYGGGQILTNGPVSSDTNPVVQSPLASGWAYQLSSSSPALTGAIAFAPLAGGWGPRGFVMPQITTASDM